ncbi:hypothetical protein HMPREF6485_0067 [Segatella buccae ATCC 33574]|uniref:Uncharacterized protein n=1 Tax=Segatella buccae ATCC 33574 TaxID=873513 RepID=E6K382_9BACT|nr:hypothetical protein HMPREF6485_0067 [Segatella buccae ATCC 33574]
MTFQVWPFCKAIRALKAPFWGLGGCWKVGALKKGNAYALPLAIAKIHQK